MSDESTFYVVSTAKENEDGSRPTLLWEKDSRHPGGEAFIASGKKPVKVANTERVAQLLAEGKIKKVAAPDAKSASTAQASADKLPTDFPGYEVLASKGVTTRSAVAKLSIEDMKKFGLDDETIKKIRAMVSAK